MATGIGTTNCALDVLMRWNFGKTDASQSSQVVLIETRTIRAEAVRPGRTCTKEGVSLSSRAVFREMRMMNVRIAITSESWSQEAVNKSLNSALN